MGKMETPKVIIDTDILIDLLRNKKEAVAFITQLENEKTSLSTTAINAFELYYGAHKSSQPEKGIQATKKLLNKLILLPLTPRSAQKAGHIYAKLEASGNPIGLRDTLIAAIALTREFSLATRNVEHFKKIEDLRIITNNYTHTDG
jgi:tRNA(fMet)-specific endonuclease VapC